MSKRSRDFWGGILEIVFGDESLTIIAVFAIGFLLHTIQTSSGMGFAASATATAAVLMGIYHGALRVMMVSAVTALALKLYVGSLHPLVRVFIPSQKLDEFLRLANSMHFVRLTMAVFIPLGVIWVLHEIFGGDETHDGTTEPTGSEPVQAPPINSGPAEVAGPKHVVSRRDVH